MQQITRAETTSWRKYLTSKLSNKTRTPRS